MGQPVVHFEVIGNDADKLHAFYSKLFGWKISSMPMGDGVYGMIGREDNLNPHGVGIGGGVGSGMGPGHVTFYVEVPDVEAALVEAVSIGGQRLMGPDKVGDGLVVGMLSDPEGHAIGVIEAGWD
jgi:hypothetical protein